MTYKKINYKKKKNNNQNNKKLNLYKKQIRLNFKG